MKQSTMEAYAEVDTILNLMEPKYILEIPKKLREMFTSKKAMDYKKIIVANKPLEEQGLKQETLEILAVLNYNYWCKDINKKKELLDLYHQNDLKREQELREKYNPDNIFKKKTTEDYVQKNDEEVSLTVVEKESFINKIIKFIKSIFKK